MRRTIGLVALVIIGAFLLRWWQLRPSTVTGAVWNHVGAPVETIGPDTPSFNYAAFHFDHEPYSIVCLLRVNGQTEWDREALIPWVENEEGCVAVEGRRILPRRDALQVFVAEGSASPSSVVLKGTDREVFDRFIQSDQGYEGCRKLWDEMKSRMIAARETKN
jgi:hypothetical protein